MSFAKFFKDALLPVAVWTCGVLLSCFVLTVAGAPVSIVVVAVGVSYIFGMLGIVIEYARRRRFLRQLERAAEELESPAWVQEMVQCPTYAEGELEYEVLRRVGKAACDEVAEGRRQTDDYRDYIESWVHEAKLPLAAAHLILENLDGSEDDLSRVDDLGRELARVERYIDQALYYARSEVVERDYLIRRWDLKTLVTGAIKANARELIAAHVAPVCENLDFEVFTDEKWLEFILGQLIQNSIKYAREDGAKIVFSGALLDEGLASERIELTVADNGCGVSAADLPRVFEKGFRRQRPHHQARNGHRPLPGGTSVLQDGHRRHRIVRAQRRLRRHICLLNEQVPIFRVAHTADVHPNKNVLPMKNVPPQTGRHAIFPSDNSLKQGCEGRGAGRGFLRAHPAAATRRGRARGNPAGPAAGESNATSRPRCRSPCCAAGTSKSNPGAHT